MPSMQPPNGTRRAMLLTVSLLISIVLYLTSDAKQLGVRLNQASWSAVGTRIQWWDWQDTPEEIFCRGPHPPIHLDDPIPNIVHFILLGPDGHAAELNFARFLAIKAAVLRMQADEIKLHTYGLNTSNPWWTALAPHVTLVDIDRRTVRTPHDIPLESLQLAHQADLLRLAILLREGGIYMDTDVFALKPFADLLHSPRDTLMGHEGGNRYGLCNAVIVARANSDFLVQWHAAYASSFDPHHWNVHSVQIPKRLQVQYPDLICPLSPTVFFWPTWAAQHVRYMHEAIAPPEVDELRRNLTAFDGAMYANQLAFHAVAASDYLPDITLEQVLQRDTRFNILVREIAAAPLAG